MYSSEKFRKKSSEKKKLYNFIMYLFAIVVIKFNPRSPVLGIFPLFCLGALRERDRTQLDRSEKHCRRGVAAASGHAGGRALQMKSACDGLRDQSWTFGLSTRCTFSVPFFLLNDGRDV